MSITVQLGENTSLALLAAQEAQGYADTLALENLPTADPLVAWAFWNDAGTRKLSASTPAGSVTSIVGITGSLAEFNAALTGADFATGGGTATGTNTGDQDLSGYALTSAVAAAYQPLDSDLTDIAALTTTAFGRGFLDLADAAAGRTKLALGTAALSTAPSGAIVGTTDTQVLTNKMVRPVVTTSAAPTTITPNADSDHMVEGTALTGGVTIANHTGAPVNGQKLIVRLKDNGTTCTITWGTGYEAAGVALPTATTVSKWHTVGLIYNSTSSKWQCVAAVVQV